MTSSSPLPPSTTTAVVPLANVQTKYDHHANKQYLCLFSVITAGLLDDDLGSDEQEIIEMINLIMDVDTRKVRDKHFSSIFFAEIDFQLMVMIRYEEKKD